MSVFSWLFDRPSPKHPDPRPDASRLAPMPAPAPDRSRFGHADSIPTGRFRFIAIDVQTACSDAASICQIGIACVDPDDRIETFSMLVNPRMRFDPLNIRLHGIGSDHVEDAPCFTDAIEMLMPLLDPHHLVQHSRHGRLPQLRARGAGLAVGGQRDDRPAGLARAEGEWRTWVGEPQEEVEAGLPPS